MPNKNSWDKKNWNSILDAISSPEASDAEDELNVLQAQRNSRRVAELMHQFVPGLTEASHLQGTTAMGMNNPSLIREGLAASMRAQSQYSIEHHSRNAERVAASVNPVPQESPPIPAPIPESSSHSEPEQGIVV
jgi:hypothetical protein